MQNPFLQSPSQAAVPANGYEHAQYNDQQIALTQPSNSESLMDVEQNRAIAEVQAAMVIAKKFKRNQIEAMDRILQSCTRPTLAEHALYTYARGGTDISGPSIRLAEAIAQNWGNIQFGIRELSQSRGESTVEAYAWDIETNTRQVKTFQVPHVRYSKAKGNVRLNDPRDIYELIANQGARRLRACILGIIPGDVVDSAVAQCETTLKTRIQITPERIQAMVKGFHDIGVTKEMLEVRIQRRIDAVTPALMVQLGKIFNSLKDGMSSVQDWFQSVPSSTHAIAIPAQADDSKSSTPEVQPPTSLAEKIKKNGKPKANAVEKAEKSIDDLLPPIPPAEESSSTPVSFTTEYQYLMDIKKQFPVFYQEAKEALKIDTPKIITDVINMIAYMDKKIDQEIENSKSNDMPEA